MRPLLCPAGLETLRPFCRPGTLLALDFDGTLAPIVADPARAFMEWQTRELVGTLSGLFPTVILTGRARQDAASRIDLAGVEVIGNHGMESGRAPPAELVARVAGWKSRLEGSLPRVEGIVLEDKGVSLSVHYRGCASPAIAAELVRRAAAGLPGARLVGGKCVLNILPDGAPDKGDALLDQLRATGSTRAIFVGDDVTDEAVFRINTPRTLLTIRVGHHPRSRASHYVSARDEVDAVLQAIAQMRQECGGEHDVKGARAPCRVRGQA